MKLEGYILDKSFDTLAVIDTFQSFTWTVRYAEAGEFELIVPATLPICEHFVLGNYIILSDDQSDRMMIIETISYQTDLDNGNLATITGRSLESILDRRVIWGYKEFNDANLQDGIQTLLTENVISPSDTSRKIPNFVFEASNDSAVSSLTFSAQYLGENLYDSISALCTEHDLGFRILPDYTTGGFIFELYAGVDRTYSQDSVPYVMFCPSFDNILSSNYAASTLEYKNAVLIGGNGDGSAKTLATVSTSSTGLDRRETYIDSTATKEEETTDEQYKLQLQQEGLEELAGCQTTAAFDAEVDATRQFVYGVDFDLGDIVDVEDDYANSGECRVSSIIISEDASGYQLAPSFTIINKEE